MPTLQESIKKLELKLKQKKAKQQLIEARQRAAVVKADRKNDTRKKILVGAAILAKMPIQEIQALMNPVLKKPADRKLFNLQPLPENKK